MDTSCTYLPYHQTGYFSKIVLDYIQQDEKLQPYFDQAPTIEGIRQAIEARKKFPTDRELLVAELKKQYEGLQLTQKQEENLQLLLQPNTFTVCTAHQPNLFTGHLYFIYKILHTIKLADYLNKTINEAQFVPIFYMGSEDADLDELGHISLEGQKVEWKTTQTGAVGRMIVDKELVALIEQIAGRLLVEPHGSEVVQLLKEAYTVGTTIQQATLKLVHELFKSFGLLVLIPDNASLKRSFNTVVKKELLEQFSYPLVQQTCAGLSENYKVQAGGREINLFYLIDGSRERIEKSGNRYAVKTLKLDWSEEEILAELDEHPERFSANVILRGVFQETVLPNIAFIGGGGEIAYWLELKQVFDAVQVPFPVLIVRNSFLLVNRQQKALIEKLGFTTEDTFASEEALIEKIVARESDVQLTLEKEIEQIRSYYYHLKTLAGKVDITLTPHVDSLLSKAEKTIIALERKMLRAEKRKHEDARRQIQKIKQQLFPKSSLQERVDNFSIFYAKYGKAWLDSLYESSLTLQQQFAILEIA